MTERGKTERDKPVCRTCGATIEVPDGWSAGPAVRRHYWQEHPDRMQRTRADKQAERALPERGAGTGGRQSAG